MSKQALIALEDGTLFYGSSDYKDTIECGELVFNTAMTGYQEVCTDPSYANQMVVFTASHIGNVGINNEDYESDHAWVKAIIVREMSTYTSNWRSEQSFISFLKENNIPWIERVDTRKLVRHLQKTGSQNGCLVIGEIMAHHAIQMARAHKKASGLDLSQTAIQEKVTDWATNKKNLSENLPLICVYDFGIKTNILRKLDEYECRIKIVPGDKSADDLLELNPQGIVLSNGPGDPASSNILIENIKKLIASKIPLLGICFGMQLLGIAAGGKTIKMKFGHHGINHPVYDIEKQKVHITSQNHNFMICQEDLPKDLEITHFSLFDKTIQGFRSRQQPLIAFQGHPEGSPGPQDVACIFEEFFKQINIFIDSESLVCH